MCFHIPARIHHILLHTRNLLLQYALHFQQVFLIALIPFLLVGIDFRRAGRRPFQDQPQQPLNIFFVLSVDMSGSELPVLVVTVLLGETVLPDNHQLQLLILLLDLQPHHGLSAGEPEYYLFPVPLLARTIHQSLASLCQELSYLAAVLSISLMLLCLKMQLKY